MTNSQKAFEELVVVNIHKYDHPISANYTYENHLTDLRNAWQAAWDARGLFDEEVYEEKRRIAKDKKYSSDAIIILDICYNEIRKRGGE